jgi:L-lactate permease
VAGGLVASVVSMVALVALVRVWQPKNRWKRRGVRGFVRSDPSAGLNAQRPTPNPNSQILDFVPGCLADVSAFVGFGRPILRRFFQRLLTQNKTAPALAGAARSVTPC